MLDLRQGLVQLRPAIAAFRGKDVAGQAFAMDADQGGLVRIDIAFDEGKMVTIVHRRAKQMQLEIPIVGWQGNGLLALDELLPLSPVGNQILYAANLEAVLLLEFEQLRQSRHRAVFIENFADDRRRIETGQPGEVDGGLRVTGPPQDPSRTALQRKHVTRLHQVRRHGIRSREQSNGQGPVSGTYAGGDSAGGVDGDGKVSLMHLAVVGDHSLQAELARSLRRDRRANQPAPVLRHEIDGGIGDLGGRHDQIAFVFTVSVVRHDNDAPLPDIGDSVRDRVKARSHEAFHESTNRPWCEGSNRSPLRSGRGAIQAWRFVTGTLRIRRRCAWPRSNRQAAPPRSIPVCRQQCH